MQLSTFSTLIKDLSEKLTRGEKVDAETVPPVGSLTFTHRLLLPVRARVDVLDGGEHVSGAQDDRDHTQQSAPHGHRQTHEDLQ